MVVSTEPLVCQEEDEDVVSPAVDAVSTTSSQGGQSNNSNGFFSNQKANDSKSSKTSSSDSQSSCHSSSCSNSNNDDDNHQSNVDNNCDNASKASVAATHPSDESSSSSSSCESKLPDDVDQWFQLQVTGYRPSQGKGDTVIYGEVIDHQFFRLVGPSGQKAVIPLPQQLHDYIPDDVWKVFGTAILAPLSDGVNQENKFAMRMHVVKVFIPCIIGWFLMTMLVRERNKVFVVDTTAENEEEAMVDTDATSIMSNTFLFSFLAAVFWAIAAAVVIRLVLRRARKDMESKTFRLIDHSTRHWAPIFRGLGWNVTFEIDEQSRLDRKGKGVPKSYLVFEPVGLPDQV